MPSFSKTLSSPLASTKKPHSLLVRLLTGRSTGFIDPRLDSDEHVGERSDPVRDALRRLLGLTATNTDIAIKVAVQAIQAVPPIKRKVEGLGIPVLLSPTFWTEETPTVTRAEFVGNRDGFARTQLKVRDAEFPTTVLNFETRNDRELAITEASGEVTLVRYGVAGTVVYPEWPESWGLVGGVDTDVPVSVGSRWELGVTPSSYPTSTAAEAIQTVPGIHGWLSVGGVSHLMGSNPLQDVASVAFAIIQSALNTNDY